MNFSARDAGVRTNDLVPRMLRSTVSAFTRVFDTLW
jgi:hypothetical protein